MKPLLIGLLALVASAQISARTFTARLDNSTPVFEENFRGGAVESVTLKRGTVLTLDDDSFHHPDLGRVFLVLSIHDVRSIRSDYRFNKAREINRNSDRNNYMVSARDIDYRRGDGGGGVHRPRRDQVVTRRDTVRTEVIDYGREYEVCYERPKSRIVQINESQRKRGNRNVVGGVAGAIFGQVLGGVTGNEDLGNVVSAIGLGFAAVGAVQIADSKDVFYVDNGVDCRKYYQPDTRVYTFRRQGRSCRTTRYYSTRWNGTHEYFETNCSGSNYISFQRSRDIWAY